MCTADKEMNMEAILLVMYTTYAVVKIGPKKFSSSKNKVQIPYRPEFFQALFSLLLKKC